MAYLTNAFFHFARKKFTIFLNRYCCWIVAIISIESRENVAPCTSVQSSYLHSWLFHFRMPARYDWTCAACHPPSPNRSSDGSRDLEQVKKDNE